MPRLRDGGLEVFCQPAAPTEPCEGALDDPAARQKFEAFGGIGTLDDFERLDRGASRPRPASSRHNRHRRRYGAATDSACGSGDHTSRAVAILNVGVMHEQTDQIAFRVGDDVALAAVDLLARVIAPRTATFRGFHRLAVDHSGRRAGLAAFRSRAATTSAWLIRANVPSCASGRNTPAPSSRAGTPSEAAATGSRSSPGRGWRSPPREARSRAGAQSNSPRHERLDQRPLRIRRVACIPQTLPPILGRVISVQGIVSPSNGFQSDGITTG